MSQEKKITIYCGECGRRNDTEVSRAGEVITCWYCAAKLPVPSSKLNRPQIRMFCPKCNSRLRAFPDQAETVMTCGNCGKGVELAKLEGGEAPVPPRRETDREGPAEKEADVPAVREADDASRGEAAPPQARKPEPEREEKAAPDAVKLAESELPSFRKSKPPETKAEPAAVSYCPQCGKKIEQDMASIGKEFSCPNCGKRIPAESGEAPSEAVASRRAADLRRASAIAGPLLLFVGMLLLGKASVMGSWQRFIGQNAGGLQAMGVLVGGAGAILLLIAGWTEFRSFMGTALAGLVVLLFGYAAFALRGNDYQAAIQAAGLGIMALAGAGGLMALGGEKSGLPPLIAGAVWSLFAACVLYPGMRCRDNEQKAAQWMVKLAKAENLYKVRPETDQDEDKDGEYGFLAELVGEVLPRAWDGARVRFSYVQEADAEDLNTGGSRGRGYAKLSGYLFRVYLPAADGAVNDLSCDGTAEDPGTKLDPREHGSVIDLQERAYVLYAWPKEAGWTGRKAYAVNQDGKVFYTNMEKTEYSGDRCPEGAAAYASGAPAESFLAHPFAEGGQSSDKNTWRLAPGVEAVPKVEAPPKPVLVAAAPKPKEKPAAPKEEEKPAEAQEMVPETTTPLKIGLRGSQPLPMPFAFKEFTVFGDRVAAKVLFLPEQGFKIESLDEQVPLLEIYSEVAESRLPGSGESFYQKENEEAAWDYIWIEQGAKVTPMTDAEKKWVQEAASKPPPKAEEEAKGAGKKKGSKQ